MAGGVNANGCALTSSSVVGCLRFFLSRGFICSFSSTPATLYASCCCRSSSSSTYKQKVLANENNFSCDTVCAGGVMSRSISQKDHTWWTHRFSTESYANSCPSSVSRMNWLSSLENEMRGSLSNSDGSVGKFRVGPAPLSAFGEAIEAVWHNGYNMNTVQQRIRPQFDLTGWTGLVQCDELWSSGEL